MSKYEIIKPAFPKNLKEQSPKGKQLIIDTIDFLNENEDSEEGGKLLRSIPK